VNQEANTDDIIPARKKELVKRDNNWLLYAQYELPVFALSCCDSNMSGKNFSRNDGMAMTPPVIPTSSPKRRAPDEATTQDPIV
jgi:hypothetical protein